MMDIGILSTSVAADGPFPTRVSLLLILCRYGVTLHCFSLTPSTKTSNFSL